MRLRGGSAPAATDASSVAVALVATAAVAGAPGSVAASSSPLTRAARSSNVVASPSGASSAHVPWVPVSSHAGSRSSSVSGSGASAPVEDVDDDDRDVVAAALTVGEGDELVGGDLRIRDRRQHPDDLIVADLVDEPVAAEQEAVAPHERQRPGVDAHRWVDAEGTGHDVAARVGARLVVGDVTGRHELLDVAVVDGHAPQSPVAYEVRARIAHVDEGQLLAGGRLNGAVDRCVAVGGDDRQGGDRRAHALLVRVAERGPVDVAVDLGDRRDDLLEVVAASAQAGAQEIDGEGAGDLTGAVAAHAVGDDEDVRLGEEVVLVVGPDASGIGRRAPAQLRHYCASSTV